MSTLLHSLCWNYLMISMVFLMCFFSSRGVDRDFRLRRKKPQVARVKRKMRKFLFLRAKYTRHRFPILSLVLNAYAYIQAIVFSVLNLAVYSVCPEKLDFLGNIITTVQIGVVFLIILSGGIIMWLQREFEIDEDRRR